MMLLLAGFQFVYVGKLTLEQKKWSCLVPANRKQFRKLHWRSGFQQILCANPRILNFNIIGA
jgi:hypothetical protein